MGTADTDTEYNTLAFPEMKLYTPGSRLTGVYLGAEQRILRGRLHGKPTIPFFATDGRVKTYTMLHMFYVDSDDATVARINSSDTSVGGLFDQQVTMRVIGGYAGQLEWRETVREHKVRYGDVVTVDTNIPHIEEVHFKPHHIYIVRKRDTVPSARVRDAARRLARNRYSRDTLDRMAKREMELRGLPVKHWVSKSDGAR